VDFPENKTFRAAFKDAYKTDADVYAVQGWDAMQMLDIGLKAVNGDVAKRDALNAAMGKAEFKSPRGPFKLSASHNPIQNFYLRELKGGKNVLVKTAVPAFADSGTGCRLAS
jgi:branched-chain amino acid transport system substrate-binding protein